MPEQVCDILMVSVLVQCGVRTWWLNLNRRVFGFGSHVLKMYLYIRHCHAIKTEPDSPFTSPTTDFVL